MPLQKHQNLSYVPDLFHVTNYIFQFCHFQIQEVGYRDLSINSNRTARKFKTQGREIQIKK